MWFQDSGASTVFFAFAVTLDYGVNMAQSGWEADSLGAQDELKVFKCEESESEESGLEMLEIKNPGVNIKGEEIYKEPFAQNKVDFKIKSEFKTSPAL